MACAFVSVIATSSVATATGTQPGDVIITWNGEALDAVREESVGTPDAARIYAIVNAAMYDAVNGIDRKRRRGREAALVTERLLAAAPRRGNREAAAVGAAYTVLSRFVEDLELSANAQIELNNQLAVEMLRLDGAKGADRGFKWGVTVGNDVYHNRLDDGYRPVVTREPGFYGDGPGDFRGRFGSVQYADLEPFAIEDPEDYESDGPPKLRSRAYATAFNDVKLMGEKGGADNEDEERELLETVCFWQGSGGSARPPGEWIKVTGVVADGENTTKSISETARLFALQGLAMGDAVIPAWISKDKFGFWRPRTAVENADTDGNRHTEAVDPWVPRNIGTGSSPEHTSGQSTFAGAGSTILAGFYGTDHIEFTFAGDDGSDRTCSEVGGNEERTYSSFSDAAREAGRARIFAGIHFEFSNQAGQASGRGLAREILEESLQPLDDDEDDD